VWLATTEEHHQSLRQEFPNMRSIQVLGKKVTGWQVLPADAEDFEEAGARANSFSQGTLESGRCWGSGPDRRLRRQRKSRSTRKRRRRPQNLAPGREQSPILIAVQRCDIVRHNGVVSVMGMFQQLPRILGTPATQNSGRLDVLDHFCLKA
jgi:hypothetical protein